MRKFALALFLLTAATPTFGVTLSDGSSAYEQNKVAEAERIYSEVASDKSASAEDRANALRELARIAWLIDRDAPKALAQLAAARLLGDKPCETAAMQARVLREARRWAEAISQSDALLSACPEPSRRDAILLHMVGSRLDLAADTPSERARLLADASVQSTGFSPDAGIRSAEVKLEAALLVGNAGRALAAWKDYFWLTDTDAPQVFSKDQVSKVFADGLRPTATAAARLKLADLLMRAGFYQQAKRFSDLHSLAKPGAGTATWRKLSAYFAMREHLDPLILNVNRGLARGRRDDNGIEDAVKQWSGALLKAAGVTRVPDDPRPLLLKHYGLVGGAGQTNGYPGLNVGHVIEDRYETIRQYGKIAKVHLQVIDHMISNGFESWLWDGDAMTGGWSSRDVIVHVRPGYVSGPLSSFAMTRDGTQRRDLLKRQPKRAIEDLAKLKKSSVATLNGLNDRLYLQLVDRIAATAQTKSDDEASFRRAFLAEYYRANLDQSIEKHEGRHAIDEVLGLTPKVEQAVLEYDAKLSELALADYPRMAMRNMNNGLEGSGPHDRAAARIFAQYIDWVERNRDQVIGYDPALPAMAQLDKLTDPQIREIARSLDRLARGEVTAPAKL